MKRTSSPEYSQGALESEGSVRKRCRAEEEYGAVSTIASSSSLSSRSSSLTTLIDLPARVLHVVFSHLRLNDIRNVLVTCKKLSACVDHPLVWRSAFINSLDPKEEPIRLFDEGWEYIIEEVTLTFRWPSCGHSFFVGRPKNLRLNKKEEVDEKFNQHEKEEKAKAKEFLGVEKYRETPKRCFICYSNLSKDVDYKSILRDRWFCKQIGNIAKEEEDKEDCWSWGLIIRDMPDYTLEPFFLSSYPVADSKSSPGRELCKLSGHDDVPALFIQAGSQLRWEKKTMDQFFDEELSDQWDAYHIDTIAKLKRLFKREDTIDGSMLYLFSSALSSVPFVV
eukprot:TRINITY_DN2514_c0_g1_i3.p1 TRINITY_DN2514_c0_g1~~TRINITY_DN2514_c0_g1_i3.p1  ORF type:complete len:336 (+),score=90.62 TRINITY_DN2514_c0_g1_i3:132-1139(+)